MIEFCDLKAQQARIKDKIDAGIQRVLAHGQYILGPEVAELEEKLAAYTGAKHCITVANGTDALQIAQMALGIGPGDEVITTTHTFTATAEVVRYLGADVVLVDIDPATLCLDVDAVERAITPRTKAVIVVHMLGTPSRLPEIKAICDEHGIALIEDAAWGCGGSLNGRALGSWGPLGTFSFDFAKTMTTGEGGLVLFQEQADWARGAAWHDHGHENNPAVPRWEDTRASSGFNFRMMELQGAVGLAQLRKLPDIVTAQRRNREQLWNAIRDLPGITPREVPAGSYETADALVFFVQDNAAARRCREALLARGLATKILPEAFTWHFAGTWTHMPELAGAHGGDLSQAFPQSAALLSRAVSLPVGVKLREDAPALAREALIEALQPQEVNA